MAEQPLACRSAEQVNGSSGYLSDRGGAAGCKGRVPIMCSSTLVQPLEIHDFQICTLSGRCLYGIVE
jgi:hypothetical protein